FRIVGAVVAQAAQARTAQHPGGAQGVDGHAARIQAPALRLAGGRVDVVAGAVAAGRVVAAVQRGRALAGPVTLTQLDFVAVVDFQRAGDTPVVAAGAEQGAPTGLGAAAVVGGVGLELDRP